MNDTFPFSKSLTLDSREEAVALCGPRDAFAYSIRDAFSVKVITRGGDVIVLQGKTDESVAHVERVFDQLRQIRRKQGQVTADDVQSVIEVVKGGPARGGAAGISQQDHGRFLRPRTDGQGRYVQALRSHDVVLAVGPAGTGKTYLAVAWAVTLLMSKAVKKIVLVRPAVEAGERLGFLPGDLKEKINPYLRPLFDSLADLLDPPTVEKYIETGVIEILPLAFMRGRTLNSACMILDEGQNATVTQMKMFLTRMGFSSKIVVTGDMTQVDLPKTIRSGLMDAVQRLKDVPGIATIHLANGDIVRNPLVQKIVDAYDDETPKVRRPNRE